ncbi:hypothetical protein C1752_03193 [Acaryochloris thomasi RCC1774]|uniref:Uncharacterized protein n=1 Tax=Acaryochloris thomasi RCC1774 TaxID=1764569 RepID=A0A2W1JMQ5_9CYAN|nr:alpha/beta hydrolase [Acaryochloris thomasi]PZD72735.1 hypothetical protein C1752_03193 [Acaryochloris thomasi RCC1774]
MSHRKSWLFSLLFGSLAALATALPAWSAEQVYFKFGSLELPLSVPALAMWAETGAAEPDLDTYLSLLTSQQRAQLRELLQTRYDENYFNLSYMAYTSIGERFLKNVGQLVRTRDKGNGFEELQTAFVNASKADEGISFISMLQQYPEDIEIDVAQILGLAQRAKGLVSETDAFMAKLAEVATAAAQEQSLDGQKAQLQAGQSLTASAQQPDLRQKGSLKTVLQPLQVQGSDLKFDLYHPQQLSRSMPVVVITAGFGAEQDFFEDLAHHLASYGFAVVVPVHAGSNKPRRQAFFAGQHQELFPVTEYIKRPQEVTAVLDDLERRNAGQFQNQLNLEDVGVFGHSFGGPTALSLGGAELNFEQLQQTCEQMDLLNISLYYQCYALELPPQSTQLRDRRVKALFLLGPFSSSLFGPEEMSKLDLPILWEATDIDLPAPLLLEQMPTFKGLTTPDRYLAVSEGLPHAHITFEVISGLVKEDEVERLEELSMTYQKALTVAFFKTHVAEDEAFRPYLQSSYAQSISEAPYSLHFLDAEASEKLFE